MKNNEPFKKSSARPADPKIIELPNALNEILPLPKLPTETTGEAAEEVKNLRLQAFPDGFIFRITDHPTEKGKFVLFDVSRRPVAVLESLPIAELICQAVRMLFHAVEESKRPRSGNLPEPDNNLPAPENGLPVFES